MNLEMVRNYTQRIVERRSTEFIERQRHQEHGGMCVTFEVFKIMLSA
jgi:hypothetical protein